MPANNAMNLLLAILNKICAEIREQRRGRRALHEVKFAKYKIAPRADDRLVQQRLLRRLPRSLKPALSDKLTTC